MMPGDESQNHNQIKTGELFRQMVEAVKDYAIFMLDPAGYIVSWNSGAERIKGYESREIIGKHFSIFYPPQDIARGHPQQELEIAIRDGHYEETGLRVRKDGSLFWANVVITAIFDAQGKLNGFTKVTRDISEWKHVDRELKLKSEAIDNSLSAFDIVNSQGQFVYVNDAYCRMWGYKTLSEVLKTSPVDHCVDPKIPEKIISTLKSQGECDIEFEARRKDHSTFHVRMLARLAYDAEGNEIYPTSSIDISEDVLAQEKLRQSEQQYHITFDQAPVGIINTAPDGRFLRVNRYFAQLLGYAQEELQQMNFADITHPEDLVYDRQAAKDLVAKRLSAYSREKRYLRKDGTVVWAQVDGQMLFNSDGSPRHTVTVVQDISRRKLAEERQRLLEEQLKFLSETTKDLLGEPLGHHKLLEKLVNSVVPRLADWCAVDVLNDNHLPELMAVGHVDPNKIELARELRMKYPPAPDRPVGSVHVIQTGKAQLISHIPEELISSLASNQEHEQLLKALGLRSFMCVPIEAHGEILGALTLVSEGRHYLQSDLAFAQELANRAALALYNARLYDDAQKAIRLRDEFISVCSHELKTPLTTLKLKYQLAERMIKRNDSKVYDPKTVKNRVDVTSKQVERMSQLIDDMLDVSRISSGGLEVEREVLDFRHLLEEVVEDFREQFEAMRVSLSLLMEQETFLLLGNRYRLEQLISNLLTNALKYGNGSAVSVHLKRVGSELRFSVTDKGIGIETEQQDKIFQRFERAVSSINISGLGLGLYISAQIVKMHEGKIEVMSKIGEGSTFTVTLPLQLN
jgi:PAS domain S-box-containing protein